MNYHSPLKRAIAESLEGSYFMGELITHDLALACAEGIERKLREKGFPANEPAMTERIQRVIRMHAERRLDGDGFTIQRCRECGWNWPCPTYRLATDGEES